MIRLIIPGEPVAKGRPRITRNGHAYTPEKTTNYENLVRLAFMQQCGKTNPYEGEITAVIDAYMQIPKSASKKRQEAMRCHETRPTKRPDGDNIAKAVLDSLNGLAYKDDSQVVDCTIRKFYSDKPRVELRIIPAGEIAGKESFDYLREGYNG